MDYNKIIIALAIVLVAIVIAGIVVFNPFMSKTDTTVAITSNNELNQSDELSISLTDVNGTPLAKQVINITITDSNGGVTAKSLTTDENGVGVISLSDLAAGQYNVNVTYNGNSTYSASNTSQQLTIKEKVVESVVSSDPKTYASGLTDEEIEARIQNDLEIRKQNGVTSKYDYEEARSFYENVPPTGMV